MAEIMKTECVTKGLRIRSRVVHNRADLWVRTDKGRVEQVLAMLLGNAILSAHRGGTIDVHFTLEQFSVSASSNFFSLREAISRNA